MNPWKFSLAPGNQILFHVPAVLLREKRYDRYQKAKSTLRCVLKILQKKFKLFYPTLANLPILQSELGVPCVPHSLESPAGEFGILMRPTNSQYKGKNHGVHKDRIEGEVFSESRVKPCISHIIYDYTIHGNSQLRWKRWEKLFNNGSPKVLEIAFPPTDCPMKGWNKKTIVGSWG